MRVFLVDGTFELFRQFYGAQRHRSESSMPTAGVVGVLASVLQLLEEGATHVGVATDHVIESFRNGLWAGYKTGAGIDPVLRGQFEPLELALEALGVLVWPMVDLEADDALASACAVCRDDPACEQVVICSPDKDLAQCVVGGEVVLLDRIRKAVIDEAAVLAKYGVPPASIPDNVAGWDGVGVRSAGALAGTLAAARPEAALFKRLATLVVDRSLLGAVDDLRWTGPTAAFSGVAEALGAPGLAARAELTAVDR